MFFKDKKNKESKLDKVKIIMPYYINQERLFDIYAILNEGYSEYTDITTNNSYEANRKVSGNVEGNGFKVINLGASIDGSAERSEYINTENKTHKIQTVTSILSIVENRLRAGNYIKELSEAKNGDFICIPVNLKLNSVNNLLKEMEQIINISEFANKKTINKQDFGKLKKVVDTMISNDEVYCERDDYAVFGTIKDSNYYVSENEDILHTDIYCLANIKNIYENGTTLLKNTMFSKINNDASKNALVEVINGLSNSPVYQFTSSIKSKIENKPTYYVEIIALYQLSGTKD